MYPIARAFGALCGYAFLALLWFVLARLLQHQGVTGGDEFGILALVFVIVGLSFLRGYLAGMRSPYRDR